MWGLRGIVGLHLKSVPIFYKGNVNNGSLGASTIAMGGGFLRNIYSLTIAYASKGVVYLYPSTITIRGGTCVRECVVFVRDILYKLFEFGGRDLCFRGFLVFNKGGTIGLLGRFVNGLLGVVFGLLWVILNSFSILFLLFGILGKIATSATCNGVYILSTF